MFTFVAVFVLCVSAASACGRGAKTVEDDFDKIVGGQPADKGEYPWQVTLQRSSWGGSYHFCGGAIIDATTVVTAAHCLEGVTASSLKVVAGEHRLNVNDGTEQTVSVSSIRSHSGYNNRLLTNDIAILKLASPLNLNSQYITAVCLPTSYQEHSGYCTVTGWGALREGGSMPSVLYEVAVPIVTDARCRQQYGTSRITDSMLCAGYPEGNKDACQGDSGGPFVCKNPTGEYVLAGVVSWGSGCARPGFSGVYTQVSHFLPWIAANRV